METMNCGGELIGRNEERIYVSVRLRPLNDKEILNNDVSAWECVNKDTVVYKNASLLASERSMYPTAYTFDSVFSSDCSTKEVYEEGAKDVALSAVHGFNSNVFAYGQTSSGKTYTMSGIVDYAIADIYEYIRKHPERDFILKFSAMDIYNESVRDLLSADGTPLRLLDDPERVTIVDKLKEEILTDRNHVTQLLSICEAQRQISETTFNEMSSRYHQIIRLTIESSSHGFLGKDNTSTLAATVNFVDLAGSEQASQSLSAGTRLKEGCHINCSLLALGTVIRKLSKERNGHIPYGDSKLTRILQTSLGGNARTAIICMVSPAQSHVEQSRNTLLFASCAKEVTTNAKVNVILSDKALVKHLQKELARLESELRGSRCNSVPSNYSAILRQKDAQIEKLEKEIRDLILQRDIAQSQVKELLQILGDDASPLTQVGLGNYPPLRVRKSPEAEIQEKENFILADGHSSDNDTRKGHSRSSSGDHFAKVPDFNEHFDCSNASQRIFVSSPNSNARGSRHSWDGVKKQNKGILEDLSREIRCIETEEMGNIESDHLSSEDYTGSPAVRVRVNGDGQVMGSASPALFKDEISMLSPVKDDNEMKEDKALGMLPSNKDQELISASVVEDKESISRVCEKERDFSSLQYPVIKSLKNPLQCLGITALENRSLTRHLAKDSFGTGSLNLSRSKSFEANTFTDITTPWLKLKEYGDKTPSVGSGKEFEGSGRKTYALNSGSSMERLSREGSHSPSESALDIEINNSVVKVATDEDGGISNTLDLMGKAALPAEQEISMKPEEIAANVNKSSTWNVKDVGLDPIEDQFRVVTSWPAEFKRLQREIIELWHACNVSLAHRTNFFLLFQGDPSDAIYLEVELTRMKSLRDKFSRGDKTIVNGRRLTLSSSKKALRRERQMLSQQMLKKFSEEERKSLFLEWGIEVNTKMRRLQLAHLIWTKTEDMNHIADSALLVAKLVGFVEPGEALNKEIFALNFTPKCSTGICTFKRSLVSIL